MEKRKTFGQKNSTATPWTAANFLIHLLPPRINMQEYMEVCTRISSLTFSAEHCARMMRMLPFAFLVEKERLPMFHDTAEELDWAPRTINTYWGTLLTVLNLVEKTTTFEEKRFTTQAGHDARTAPTWDMQDETQIISNSKVEELERWARQSHPRDAAVAALATLRLGQRLGDMLKNTAAEHDLSGHSRCLSVDNYSYRGEDGAKARTLQPLDGCVKRHRENADGGDDPNSGWRDDFFDECTGGDQEGTRYRSESVAKDRFDKDGSNWSIDGSPHDCQSPRNHRDAGDLLVQGGTERENTGGPSGTVCSSGNYGKPDGAADLEKWRASREDSFDLLHKALGGHKGDKPRTRKNGNPQNLPLHCKTVGLLDYEACENIIIPECKDAWDRAFYQLFDEKHLGILADKLKSEVNSRIPRDADVTQEDMTLLLHKGLIRKVHKDEIAAHCNVFTVEETVKKRRRLIVEPFLNDVQTTELLGPMDLHTLCSPLEIVDQYRDQQYFAELHDFPWWYGQFKVPVACQKYYGFNFEGDSFVVTTAPTGARWLPQLAEALCHSVAATAAQAAKQGNCKFATFIDNTRFLTTTVEDGQAVNEAFVSISKKIAATMNPESLRPNLIWQYEFLGVACRHLPDVPKQAAISTKTIQKLAKYDLHDTSLTLRDLKQILGVLMYATRVQESTVNSMDMSSIYYVLKFFRRRCSECRARKRALDDPADMWQAAKRVMIEWIAFFNGNWGNLSEKKPPNVIMYTDATPTGLGVIIMVGTKIHVTAEVFLTPIEDISTRELRAVEVGLRRCAELGITNSTIEIRIDNTSALWGIRRGANKDFIKNAILHRIYQATMEYQWILMAEYVNTKLNFADTPSRLNQQLNFSYEVGEGIGKM